MQWLSLLADVLQPLLKPLDGYKTYLAGAAIVCVGLLYGCGAIDQATLIAIATPLVGITGISLRMAQTKSESQVAQRVANAMSGLVHLREQLQQAGPANPVTPSGGSLSPGRYAFDPHPVEDGDLNSLG